MNFFLTVQKPGLQVFWKRRSLYERIRSQHFYYNQPSQTFKPISKQLRRF